MCVCVCIYIHMDLQNWTYINNGYEDLTRGPPEYAVVHWLGAHRTSGSSD